MGLWVSVRIIAKANIQVGNPGFVRYLRNETRYELIETFGVSAIGSLVGFNRRYDSIRAFLADLSIDGNKAQRYANGCQVDAEPNQPFLPAGRIPPGQKASRQVDQDQKGANQKGEDARRVNQDQKKREAYGPDPPRPFCAVRRGGRFVLRNDGRGGHRMSQSNKSGLSMREFLPIRLRCSIVKRKQFL